MHDANGTLLKTGDRVNIPCTIKDVFPNTPGQPDNKYCNLQVETDFLMGADDPGAYKVGMTLNAGQVVLVERPKVAAATKAGIAAVLLALGLGLALSLSACVTSKVTTVTAGVTNTVTAVNTNQLAVDAAALQFLATPVFTAAIVKYPAIVPVLRDVKTGLDGILYGANADTLAAVLALLPNGWDAELDAQIAPLLTAASNFEQQALANYGGAAAVQISRAAAGALDRAVSAALLTIPQPAK